MACVLDPAALTCHKLACRMRLTWMAMHQMRQPQLRRPQGLLWTTLPPCLLPPLASPIQQAMWTTRHSHIQLLTKTMTGSLPPATSVRCSPTVLAMPCSLGRCIMCRHTCSSSMCSCMRDSCSYACSRGRPREAMCYSLLRGVTSLFRGVTSLPRASTHRSCVSTASKAATSVRAFPIENTMGGFNFMTWPPQTVSPPQPQL